MRRVSEILSWIEAAGISAVIVILLLISIKCFTYGNNPVALIARGYVICGVMGEPCMVIVYKIVGGCKKWGKSVR